MNYRNSITERTMASLRKTWENELNDSECWLEQKTRERIFEFLNAKENLCTADFVLRRQIQICFPELLRRASADYADLTANGNVPWSTNSVEKLSRVLAKEKFDGLADVGLDNRQWKKILLGEAFCNRASAIKLIFALKMDEATAAKFLIANRKGLFSMRNPFDYLCVFCLKGNFTYDTAVDLLKKFEAERKESLNNKNRETAEFVTIRLENETQKILDDDTLCAESKQFRIVECMLENQLEFVAKVERKDRQGNVRRVEYPSGFSRSNNRNLKIFLKYLTTLYPNFLQWKALNEFDSLLLSKSVEQNADGSPKNLEHLMQAMRESQEIYLWEDEELEEIGLPTGNETDATSGKRLLKKKLRYDAIPFNGAVLLPLKNLSKTLRANLRGDEHIDNAQEVDRSTILFLAYFFISGCLMPERDLDALATMLETEIAHEEDEYSLDLLYSLNAVVNNAESAAYEENPVELYINSLNEVLTAFNCSKFYAPFVIDRCVLLCLLSLSTPSGAEDFPQYLFNLLIDESYRLSKKILAGKFLKVWQV